MIPGDMLSSKLEATVAMFHAQRWSHIRSFHSITDAQLDFKSNYGSRDAMLALYSIINVYIVLLLIPEKHLI